MPPPHSDINLSRALGANDTETGGPSSAGDSPLSSPTMQPSPNDLIQETSTIVETLSSELPAAARPTLTKRSNTDEISALRRLRDGAADPDGNYPNQGSSRNHSRSRSQRRSSSTHRHRGSILFISSYEKSFVNRLVSRYISYMNGALPVINETRLVEIADRVYTEDLATRTSGQPYVRSRKPKDRFTVLMVIAIALASLSRSHHFSSELKRVGHNFWSEAQRLLPDFKTADLEKMRATLLQLQYAFLIPKAGSVWELSGAAMRLVTELNLHFDREADSITHQRFDAETMDTRRRLFWTAYCFDRSLSVALGRPPGLSDAWIHVQLPSLKSDAELINTKANSSGATNTPAVPDKLKQSFLSHISLRRIQSEIHCRLHSVNPRDYSLDHDGISLSTPVPAQRTLAHIMEVGPPTPNVDWQQRMMKKLHDWRQGYERGQGGPGAPAVERTDGSNTPFITKEWIDLNYNLTLSLLFRPSPNNPRPDHEGLQRAFVASGEAMKLFKAMHRSSSINFPWLATHNLFISGLTYLNSLEKLTRQGAQNPSSLIDIVFNVQSCTSVLEALTSLEDGYNTRVRDTFDTAAGAVLKTVFEPGSFPGAKRLATTLETTVNSSLSQESGTAPARSRHNDVTSTLAAAQNLTNPTWLSDATWNSSGAPPGSTILVAAPPRAREHQHQHQHQHMASAPPTSSGDFFSQPPQTSPVPSVDVPAFGFHNWLLQPYEGGGGWGIDTPSSVLAPMDDGTSPPFDFSSLFAEAATPDKQGKQASDTSFLEMLADVSRTL